MTVDLTPRLLMPSLDQLESVLSNLMNTKVLGDRLRKGAPMPDLFLAGLYHDQDDLLRAVIRVDFAFALDCGARLSMIPVGVIAEARAAGQLTEAMADNVYEILNIFGLLFNEQRPGAPRVRLVEVVDINALPEQAQELLANPKAHGVDATITWAKEEATGFVSVRVLTAAPSE